MYISPFGASHLPPEKLSPKDELHWLLDLLTQIQTQLTQNRGKTEILQGLQKEFEDTLDQIQERLSPSRVGSLLSTLDALQGQLYQLVTNLQKNASPDTIRQTSAAVTTLIARLQNDLLPQRLR